ncbi:MAG: VOC family protein [Acidimicrobiia bacterium]
MQLGKLFHLTMLVDDWAGPEKFFNSVFAPMTIMRGYSDHWHRHAAVYIIGETSIEPMHVLPPAHEGQAATSWYRFMERFGPRIHNLAFYVDDVPALDKRFGEAGVRTTDGGSQGKTLFAHPKDTPGMVEFFDPADSFFEQTDPRFTSDWKRFTTEYWTQRHPLGLVRMSHVTSLVHDVEAAAAFFVNVLGASRLTDQTPTFDGTTTQFLLVGEDTVIELAKPLDTASALGRELATVGEGPMAVTFLVADRAKAWQHLQRAEGVTAPVETPRAIEFDRAATWGVQFRFTDERLAGDPRE